MEHLTPVGPGHPHPLPVRGWCGGARRDPAGGVPNVGASWYVRSTRRWAGNYCHDQPGACSFIAVRLPKGTLPPPPPCRRGWWRVRGPKGDHPGVSALRITVLLVGLVRRLTRALEPVDPPVPVEPCLVVRVGKINASDVPTSQTTSYCSKPVGHAAKSQRHSSCASRRTAALSGILAFDPIGRAAGAIGRRLELGDERFEPELTRVPEHHRAFFSLDVPVQAGRPARPSSECWRAWPCASRAARGVGLHYQVPNVPLAW